MRVTEKSINISPCEKRITLGLRAITLASIFAAALYFSKAENTTPPGPTTISPSKLIENSAPEKESQLTISPSNE